MKKGNSTVQSSIIKILKAPLLEKVLYVLLLFIVINLVMNFVNPTREGFSHQQNIVFKRNEEIYDDFYVDMYDDLYYNKIKNDYEIGIIVNQPGPTEQSVILDIGSGTGHHANSLANNNFKVVGIDKSKDMVSKAKENYPTLEFHKEDVMNRSAFPASTFTHISCMNFTVYLFDDKKRFLDNCYYWLKPGGCLVINLVDKNKFDPVMPSGNPYTFFGDKHVEKYGKETRIKFVGYDYKSNFEVYPNDDTAVLHERFRDVKTGKQRKQELLLYMPTQKRILNIAKNIGFVFLGKYDMADMNVNSQFVYILQKPN